MTIFGMENHDIGAHFKLWFNCGFLLALAQAAIQSIAVYYNYLDRPTWIRTLYLILDAAMLQMLTLWMSFGAFWRFREWGIMCSE